MGNKDSQPYYLQDGEVQTPRVDCYLINRIICAANKMADGTIVVGVRHYDKLMLQMTEKIKNGGDFEESGIIQGFVDRYGDFHTREQAWIIAIEAGQVIRRCGGDNGRLYSENLY